MMGTVVLLLVASVAIILGAFFMVGVVGVIVEMMRSFAFYFPTATTIATILSAIGIAWLVLAIVIN